MKGITKMSDDYGYFGGGLEGYAHYNEAVKESQKSTNNGGGNKNKNNGGGCLTSIVLIISVIVGAIIFLF